MPDNEQLSELKTSRARGMNMNRAVNQADSYTLLIKRFTITGRMHR